ncbi:hypothetical protein [Alloactinosynnema sp. L-07]|uniref:hypothetical protein n=1 Tax=Alloactinosynnema sp. L-07 TaxID=1653480 RepID=UPI0006B5604C|nr:hypothetical protein [Alloactinosynnema sp. L-07]
MTTSEVLPDGEVVLRLACSADLARFTGTSRLHTESDLRIYLRLLGVDVDSALRRLIDRIPPTP